jgi:hypothetical protein
MEGLILQEETARTEAARAKPRSRALDFFSRRRHVRQPLTSRNHRILTPRQCGNECAEIGVARGQEQPRKARRDAKGGVV